MPPRKKQRIRGLREIPVTTFVEFLGSSRQKPSLSMCTHGDIADESQEVSLSKASSTIVDLQNTSVEVLLPNINASQHQDITSYPNFEEFNPSERDNIESTYVKQRRRRYAKWSELRPILVTACLEENAPPPKKLCTICKEETANIIRCSDCGPMALFCEECCCQHHRITVLHRPEIWEDDRFVLFELPHFTWERLDHQCDMFYNKSLDIIDHKGLLHTQFVRFCHCEDEAVTLVRYGFWPATPLNPNTAISIELLTTLRALVFAGQLSIIAFVTALQNKYTRPYSLTPPILRVFTWEMLLNFNLVLHQLQSLEHLALQITPSHDCAACPQVGKVIAMDGNFSLVRRKGAGSSLVLPERHPERYFYQQEEVDAFVSSYNESASRSRSTCSNFQAGNIVRSKNTTEKLEVKGIFGSVCRHDVPARFIDLKHGERLAYPVYMVRKMRNQSKMILYDIACQLESHLKNRNDVPVGMVFGVPIFHVYGHIMRCQVLYSPRRIKGAGLIDGEGTERLWSFLGDFSNITKEMTAENRRDLLTDLLLHYTTRLNNQMIKTLCQRMQKACLLSESTKGELTEVLTSLPFPVTMANIARWNEDEKARFTARTIKAIPDWRESYVLLLEEYYTEQGEGGNTDEDEMEDEPDYNLLTRLDIKISQIERKQKIARWVKDSEEYKVTLQHACHNERLRRLFQVRQEVVEYTFLQNCRKRYADGQKQAKRLNKQVIASSKKVDTAIQQYNNIPRSIIKISRPEAMELDSELYCPLDSDQQQIQHVPNATRRKALDTYNLHKRCEEEIGLLKEDMSRYKENVENRKIKLLEKRQNIWEIDNPSRLDKGKLACISKALADTEAIYIIIKHAFGPFIKITDKVSLDDLVTHLDKYTDDETELVEDEDNEN